MVKRKTKNWKWYVYFCADCKIFCHILFSFADVGLKHEQAEQVGWQLWFDGEAANFHGHGLTYAAMGFSQRLGATGDVRLDGVVELIPPVERGGNQFAFLRVADVGVGLGFFEERENFVTGQPNGFVRRARS